MTDILARINRLPPEKRAALLRRLTDEQAPRAGIDRRADPSRPAPLSFTQSRFWLLQQLDPASPSYNVHAALRVRGPLRVDELRRCLDEARRMAYRTMYLETLTGMDAAQRLYERLGFQRLAAPMGATGHHGCNRFYSLAL